MTVEILGPVPVGELSLRSRVVRPGRSVELLEAELLDGSRAVLRAAGWRVRSDSLQLPGTASSSRTAEATVPELPGTESPMPPGWSGGYLQAMEWRVTSGGWSELGPATVWGRMRHPLVPGEEPSGWQRVMIVADSGNGVSNVLPIGEWLFINPELTVHFAAVPEGEWVCLDARTRIDPAGFGLSVSRLFDRSGLVAHGAQSLYVARR